MDASCTIFLVGAVLFLALAAILRLASLVRGSPDATTEDTMVAIHLTGLEARRQIDRVSDAFVREAYNQLRRSK